MRIAGVAGALPPHYYPQEVILWALSASWSDKLENPQFLSRLHSHSRVDGRYLAMPMERYYEVTTWGQANAVWIEVAQDLGEKAIRCALSRAGLDVNDIGALFFATVTGVEIGRASCRERV